MIFLNMQQFLSEAQPGKVTDYLEQEVLEEIREEYGEFLKQQDIGLAYYSARREYRLIRELPMGRGFADIIFLPLPGAGKPALVVELKYDKTAGAAIEQIKERKYTKALEGYTGEMLLVGINYDKKQKTHSCRIEKLDLH